MTTENSSKHVIVLTAGGTGGHVFPAESLYECLSARGHTVHFFTDHRIGDYPLKIPKSRIHIIPSGTLSGKNPVSLAIGGLKLLQGTAVARSKLKEVGAETVVGFGGYPTVPPGLAARFLGIPIVLHEANAVLGRANKLLAKFASSIAVTLDNPLAVGTAQITKTGNPVRKSVLEAARQVYDPLSPDGIFNLLVFGGSQGARFFSECVPEALSGLSDALKKRIHLTIQVRPEDLDRTKADLKAAGIMALVRPFYEDLPERIANAHLVISRSGASTVTELSVIGRPSILVPYPYALDHDQAENARFLEEVGGAWCIEQKHLTSMALSAKIESILKGEIPLSEMASKAKSAGKPNAVEALADLAQQTIANHQKAKVK